MRKSDMILGTDKANPFVQSKASLFNDHRIITEFSPTSKFWALFNEQHEIILGERGSGKTILLKMMRYSLLRNLTDPQAIKNVKTKEFIGVYVSADLEFMGQFDSQEVPADLRIPYFQFAFNCRLTRSFLYELKYITRDLFPDDIEYSKKSRTLTKYFRKIWFNNDESLVFIEDLEDKINQIYYNLDTNNENFLENTPPIFKKTIGRTIQAIGERTSQILGLDHEPKWIIAIDEAEFLRKKYQKCLNYIFRCYSDNIVIKMATLPFSHTTRETLEENVFADANGNDFRYNVLKFHPYEFDSITNKICSSRMQSIFGDELNSMTLEDFIGDDTSSMIDRYQKLFGENASKRVTLERRIIETFNESRQDKYLASINTDKNEKSIYDKLYPILLIRDIYELSTKGNNKTGWYSGASLIRLLSQGNPRRFLSIMHELFLKAKKVKLSENEQHETLMDFSKIQVEETKNLQLYGPKLYEILEHISTLLHNRTHDGNIIEAGNTFRISQEMIDDNDTLKAIKLGIAYSYFTIDINDLIHGISKKTRFSLANIVCAPKWILMRKGNDPIWKSFMQISHEDIESSQLDFFQENM